MGKLIFNEVQGHFYAGIKIAIFKTLAPFTLPLACRDPAPILCILLCVKVSDAESGEISLLR